MSHGVPVRIKSLIKYGNAESDSRLPWFDAHLYAEHYGLHEILSEDFEHGRRYGTVRIKNPFVEMGLA
jgi:hypothetical protein